MKIAAFCLCWILIGATPCVMAQQTAALIQSWDALRQFQAGSIDSFVVAYPVVALEAIG